MDIKTDKHASNLEIYEKKPLPTALQSEIESILRAEWPVNSKDKDEPKDWETTHHILLTQQGRVVSYASIVQKKLTHQDISYDTIGLSGVITHPDYRNKGYAREVIAAATVIIKKSSADLALFNTAQIGLYEKFGYERLPNAKMLNGDPTNPKIYPEDVFALFLSPKAQQHRKDFETIPIYFGQRIW